MRPQEDPQTHLVDLERVIQCPQGVSTLTALRRLRVGGYIIWTRLHCLVEYMLNLSGSLSDG